MKDAVLIKSYQSGITLLMREVLPWKKSCRNWR